MNNKESNAMVATGRVRNIRDCIFTIRDVQVMLDRDLAELYGVPTKALNQAVKRNAERFPEGFVFQLSQDEFDGLRSQIVTSNETSHLPNGVLKSQIATSKRGGLRYRPYAFTEHGIVMLASLLKSTPAASRRPRSRFRSQYLWQGTTAATSAAAPAQSGETPLPPGEP